jgi:hypothetical protein
VIFKWFGTQSQKEIGREVNIEKKKISKIILKICKLCKDYFRNNPISFGGEGLIYQLDESIFRYKPKNHRGRAS